MTERNETAQPAPLGQVERGVGRPVPERAEVACKHPRRVEQHFTYGYRMHCPDCKHSEESWWD